MRPYTLRLVATTLSCLLAPALLSVAHAQDDGGEPPAADEPASASAAGAGAETAANQIEEVFVTAQRKKERLQEVPIAVNVLSSDALTNMGIATTDDLQTVVPGLTFVTTGPAGTPYLRGVGSNAGNSTTAASCT